MNEGSLTLFSFEGYSVRTSALLCSNCFVVSLSYSGRLSGYCVEINHCNSVLSTTQIDLIRSSINCAVDTALINICDPTNNSHFYHKLSLSLVLI
jgi:hypothetical protein